MILLLFSEIRRVINGASADEIMIGSIIGLFEKQ
jgi:hypothetical protein